MNHINFQPAGKVWLAKVLLLTTTLILAGWNATAHADDKPQRYQIDLIVFEHLALKGWTEEFWPATVETAEISKAQDLSATGKAPLFIQTASPMLSSEAKRIAKNYRVLTHKSWIQNALEKNQTPALFLEGQTAGSGFYGTVKMYQSRFNHIEVDFNFDRTIPAQVKQAFADMQKTSVLNLPTQWPFHIKEKRKVKSGELHYIDHPLFGIVVQIQKLN